MQIDTFSVFGFFYTKFDSSWQFKINDHRSNIPSWPRENDANGYYHMVERSNSRGHKKGAQRRATTVKNFIQIRNSDFRYHIILSLFQLVPVVQQ